MPTRLVAGTINWWPDADGWHNVHADISARGIWKPGVGPVEPDFVVDICDLWCFSPDSFDEVRCHHVLEHVPAADAPQAVAEFKRVLVPGGVLDIEVPDLDRVVASYLDGTFDLAAVSQWLLGEQLNRHEKGDSHRSVWTEDSLHAALANEGFRVGPREETGQALRFRAVKP